MNSSRSMFSGRKTIQNKIMTNQLTDIQSQIELFLQTNPESEAVNSLIDRLKEYQSERQRQAVKAECQQQLVKAALDWKTQIPDNFPEYPENKKLREKFRRMYNQLKSQGISVTYSFLASLEDGLFQWNLHRLEQTGRLMWYKEANQWTIDGFYFQDEAGNLLNEFNDVEIL